MVVEMSAAHNPSPSALTRIAPALILAMLVVLGTTTAGQEHPAPDDEHAALADAPPGAWGRERRPAGWIVLDTRGYQLQSRLGKEPTAALGRHLDALLELDRDLLPGPSRGERLVVKVLADEAEYKAYVGPGKGGRFGRYDADSGEVVAWNTRLVLGRSELTTGLRVDPDRTTTLTYGENQSVIQLADAATRAYTPDVGSVLARCCWRQYLHERVWPEGGPALPAWLELGLAEHLATALPDARGRIRTGPSAGRIRELRWMLLDGDTRPLLELLRPAPDAPAFDAGPAPAAQGWSLIHFLLTSEDPARRDLIPRLMRELAQSGQYERSAAAAFGEVDVERLQADWQAWAVALTADDPLLDLARRYGDKVRPDQLTGDADLKRRYGWLWYRRNGPQPGSQAAPPSPQPGERPDEPQPAEPKGGPP